MIPPITGRQRASRIPLDYFKTPSLWQRCKLTATVVVVVAAAAWWTGGILLGHQDSAFYAPGGLASVHHTWESQCSACHADFHPIRDDAVGTRWEGGTPAADQKCQACHQGAEHHPVKKGGEVPGCSSCHQDHQGPQASLVRMGDRACTRCHEAIDRHIDGQPALTSPDTASVTRFDQEHHPEFASAKKDPGHLKFSHYRHLTPGVVNNLGEDKTIWTLARITDPAQRERYRCPGQGDDSPVQLDCGSCHQLDGSDFGIAGAAGMPQSLLPARAGGRYMLPITYENQCRACHPLYDKKEPGVLPAIVQHRQTPAEIRQALYRQFAAEFLQGNPELLSRPVPAEPLPNVRLPETETVERLIKEKIEIAEAKLSQEYCGKCHEPASLSPGLQAVVPTQVPQVWFRHARFDHRAHRALDCRQCHEAAYADSPHASRQSNDVLIPQREVCLQCHSPRSQSGAVSSGGARFDCVECHRYHNGSAPLAGSGAKAESPARKLSKEEFETGKPQQ
jgi:predicted CXXCH cytochrome family protein